MSLNPVAYQNLLTLLRSTDTASFLGRVKQVTGMIVEVSGVKLPVGSACFIQNDSGEWVESEVVGFKNKTLFVMPTSKTEGIEPGALVKPARIVCPKPDLHGLEPIDEKSVKSRLKRLPVGDHLLGRIVDATGKPLDEMGSISSKYKSSLEGKKINPMKREPIREPLDVGVRAINALLTVGKGQRIGLFAGSGVGKSVLLGMMAKYTKATRVVVGLIGERGREVKEFIEESLGQEGLAKSVVVAAPADESAVLRLQGASYCTTIAEYFRDQGHDVLLIMDSLTRYAMAQREIALAIGEPPATKGYPPSVFAKLPTLVERAGRGERHGGSITAFYTVLTEGDDQQDPIADSARAILDGHIVLSRTLAEQGHYPAIDIKQSISRVMQNITEKDHFDQARTLKSMFAKVEENRDLINIGAYVKGSDPMLDAAVENYSAIQSFLCQEMDQQVGYQDALNSLGELFGVSATTEAA